ncbi:RES family NAD+ phosphorylase [Olivibacter sitiensis]|uniref:RES family NAD+ phosphorylase n=1 Tax=Olivibacter sitiensis TaxID=376470 RepID=UPI0003FF5A6E|nr:RES family NAD+ phosphorylase [Olivibacter sitiensis]
MVLYRIAKAKQRATDLSGMGAHKFGGRWNNAGTYVLYTSENSSLAYLENLVHFDPDIIPPKLFITSIELEVSPGLIYTPPDTAYPKNWMEIGNLESKRLGDKWMRESKHLGVRVRSAVNPKEFNFLLNPLFPRYHDMVKVGSVEPLPVDNRLIKIKMA